jgi:hypothetical protein
MFNFLKRSTTVSITSINVRWQGATHTLPGRLVKGNTTDIEIPFTNKPQKDYNFLKVQKSPPIIISRIEVKSPFKLISISPTLPVSIEESQKIPFKLTIEVPEYAYDGPLAVELASAESQLIHLEIPKIIVNTGKTVVELKDHPLILDVQKGQVLKQTINMQKVLGLEGSVNSIRINPPFAFVSSDPKLPFKINPNDGYLIFLYVQAPQQSYGGPLELEVS